jgi:hypothetical protein
MNSVIRALLALDPQLVDLEQAIVLDWYDCPREGFLKLRSPASAWHFRIIGVNDAVDDREDRLYLLSEISTEDFDRLVDLISIFEEPARPFWVPSWTAVNPIARNRADDYIEELVHRDKPSRVFARTTNLRTFEFFWSAE